MGTDLHLDLFAVNHDSFSLKIRFPDFFGVALRKADIAAVLLAFAGKFTFLHGSTHSYVLFIKLIQDVIVE